MITISNAETGRRLTARHTPRVGAALAVYLADKRWCRGASDLFALLTPLEFAAIALQETAAGVGIGLITVSKRISKGVLLTYDIRRWETAMPALAKSVRESMSTYATEGHICKAMSIIAHNNGFHTQMDEVRLLQAGMRLYGVVCDITKLFKNAYRKKHRHDTELIVGLTPEGAEVYDALVAAAAIGSTPWYPLEHVPPPWTAVDTGPYGTTADFTLVKTDTLSLHKLSTKWPLALAKCADKLGSQKWLVNKRMLKFLQDSVATSGTLPGYPSFTLREVPTRPWNSHEEFKVLKVQSPEVIKEWKVMAKTAYDARIRDASIRRSLLCTIAMATQYTEFYMPYNADWRGRVYAACPNLSVQGDDLSKSLLHVEGAPAKLDSPQVLRYLANLSGLDKKTYAERECFGANNFGAFLDIGKDPENGVTSPLIREADAPLTLLSVCIALADGRSSGVIGFPVFVDGSCNGLQHLSALGRDAGGGHYVNLVPSEAPQDVYQVVADRVMTLLLDRHGIEDEVATFWIPHLTRKLVKRNVMTTPYGATEFGYAGQLSTEAIKMGIPIVPSFYYSQLASAVSSSIGELLVGASQVMMWLQSVAATATKEGTGIAWTSPCGLYCNQEYRQPKTKRVDVYTAAGRMRLRLKIGVAKLRMRKQCNAIAPNVIHSLDASHLVSVVNEAPFDVAVVHDSYGTHPNNMDALQDILRTTFVSQYAGDVLQELWNEFSLQLSSYVPPPPKGGCGGLDIESIIDSLYMFS